MATALYPGTFDPVTNGHETIIIRAACMFDKLIIGVGNNTKKQCMFSLEKRLAMLKRVAKEYNKVIELDNIEVVSYEGLTVDFCIKNKIEYIVRGVRANTDWSAESSIAYANQLLCAGVETVFLLSNPDEIGISSSVVREILLHKGDVSAFVSSEVLGVMNG